MAYVPERFPNHCNDRRLTEGQLLRSASVKRKPCGSPTKNGCANLTPLRFCRYFTDNDSWLVTSYIVQRIVVWRAKAAESVRVSKAGWSWGCASAVVCEGRTIWIVDPHRISFPTARLGVPGHNPF